MPCVVYDSPNGKKTKGYLLYSFVRREDLKIVCSYHASFLTPAEFVKHGGGGDIENPLKHIDIVLAWKMDYLRYYDCYLIFSCVVVLNKFNAIAQKGLSSDVVVIWSFILL